MKYMVMLCLVFWGIGLSAETYLDLPVKEDRGEYILVKNFKSRKIVNSCFALVYFVEGNVPVAENPVVLAGVIQKDARTIRLGVVARIKKSTGRSYEPWVIKHPSQYVARIFRDMDKVKIHNFLTVYDPKRKKFSQPIQLANFAMQKKRKSFSVWIEIAGKQNIDLSPFSSGFINLFMQNGFGHVSLKGGQGYPIDLIKATFAFHDRGKLKDYGFHSVGLSLTLFRLEGKKQTVKSTYVCRSDGAGPSFDEAALAAFERSQECILENIGIK